MGDQPILADLDPVGEAALDHVPAEQTLTEAEQQDAGERRNEPPRQSPAHQEPDKRHGKGDPNEPPQEPVQIFPKVYIFELIQCHCEVDDAVFRDLLVFRKLCRPVGGRKRRNDADDRFPFGNREAGESKASNAADHHHRRNHGTADEQPHGNWVEPLPRFSALGNDRTPSCRRGNRHAQSSQTPYAAK